MTGKIYGSTTDVNRFWMVSCSIVNTVIVASRREQSRMIALAIHTLASLIR